MKKMAENMEWESEAPNLAKLQKLNTFKTPDNYFEELGERINHAVFVNELQKEKRTGFTTPSNYFDTLSEKINTQISLPNFENNTDLGFNTPVNYFENLQKVITAKTTQAKKTIKIWHQPLFKYAVAASLIIVSTTGWFANKTYQENQLRKTELASEQMLYDIDEAVILEYLQEDYNAKSSVSKTEMENYILDNFSTHDLSNNL